MAVTPVTMDQLRNPLVITKKVNTVKALTTRLQDFYNVGANGSATRTIMGKDFSYDIFDKTRQRSRARADYVGPGTVTPVPIRNISAKCVRIHESMPLILEKIWGRDLGRGWGSIDRTGRRYISMQLTELARRAKTAREFMLSRMFRGVGFSYSNKGDDIELGEFGAGDDDVTFGTPAGNIGGVDALGAGNIFDADWQTAGADLLGELLLLNAASEQLSGWPIKHAWLNGAEWAKILAITQVINLAGSSNSPWSTFERETITNEDGIQTSELRGTLAGIRWLTWHINDAGQENAAETYETYAEDNKVLFTPDPSPEWLEVTQGSEIIKRNVLDQGTIASGPTSWITSAIDPASEVIKTLDCSLPTPYLPNAFFYATTST